NVEENELETNAILEYNGSVILFRSMITDITCNLNLRDFPFDQQICFLIFASWSMDGSKVQLKPTNDTNNLELYIRNTEWTLMDFAYKIYMKRYDCCPQPFYDITYFLVLKRSPSYYIFSLVIPSAFITVVTIVGFFTPHSTTGENTEKVSLGVTALLSMAIIMMMVSDEVPATSEVIPLIGKYYIGLIFLIFMAAFTTTLTLSFQMRGNAGRQLNPRIKRLLFEKIACNRYFSWAFSVQLPKRKREIHLFENDKARLNGYERGLVQRMKGKNDAYKTSEHKAHIVEMEEITGTIRNYMADCENTRCPHFMLDKLRQCVETLHENAIEERELKQIQYEWQQATRVIDRLIMFGYIAATIAFATYMLAWHNEELTLTDDVMDQAKANVASLSL
uniref:Neurotransmitter-gated ion-channel ligand-binding domain-containing protein n=1 Tax=Parascaris univalens TaxID=6257 RepID=A0A915CH68_PARUN